MSVGRIALPALRRPRVSHMYSTGFRRSAVTRTIAVALTAIFVSAPPLNAFAQLATTQHVERDSVARLLTSSRDEQHAPTPTRQRVAEEANAEKPVMPLPVLPSKLEWIVGGNGHDAWDLFDGDTTTPLTGDAELRVRLAAVTHIDAITLLGPAHGTMTVQAEDAGGTHPIAELSDVTVDLKAGEWRRVVTPGAAT